MRAWRCRKRADDQGREKVEHWGAARKGRKTPGRLLHGQGRIKVGSVSASFQRVAAESGVGRADLPYTATATSYTLYDTTANTVDTYVKQ